MAEQGGGKVVVVTGVTRGLGRAMAEGFAARGHTVVGCGRSEADLGALRQALGPPHELSRVDVADDGEVKAWADGFLGRLGAPDLLVNNAALINANAPLWE